MKFSAVSLIITGIAGSVECVLFFRLRGEYLVVLNYLTLLAVLDAAFVFAEMLAITALMRGERPWIFPLLAIALPPLAVLAWFKL